MGNAWYAALTVFGLGLGLHFGRFFSSLFRRISSPNDTLMILSQSILFLLVTVGGATLLGLTGNSDRAAFYVLGLGTGLVVTWIVPLFPKPYSSREVKGLMEVSKYFPTNVGNPKMQALLNVLPVVPTDLIQQAEKVTEEQLNDEIEEALDAAGDRLDHLQALSEALSEPEHSVYRMFFLDDLTLTSISDRLGKSRPEVIEILDSAIELIRRMESEQ